MKRWRPYCRKRGCGLIRYETEKSRFLGAIWKHFSWDESLGRWPDNVLCPPAGSRRGHRTPRLFLALPKWPASQWLLLMVTRSWPGVVGPYLILQDMSKASFQHMWQILILPADKVIPPLPVTYTPDNQSGILLPTQIFPPLGPSHQAIHQYDTDILRIRYVLLLHNTVYLI